MKEFKYFGCLILIREFEENEQPFEVRIDDKYIGDFDTLEEAEEAAKWHVKHMA